MRMGALATIGNKKPSNMVHMVLDNSLHESTSGQATVAPSIDFCAVAAACGYEHIHDITRPVELEEILSRPRNAGLTFIRARIIPGYSKDLPVNREEPHELAAQFTDFINNKS
jgi:phosphonopyruvate decarboxylase